MNSSDIEQLEIFCNDISENIRVTFSGLSLIFLIGPAEKKSATVATSLAKLSNHPAFDQAFSLCRAWAAGSEKTCFIGIAEGTEGILLSFKTRSRLLSFIGVDTGLYANFADAQINVYAMLSKLLETYEIYTKNQHTQAGTLTLQKTNPVATTYSNLKSDVFSILQMTREGSYDAAIKLARSRSLDVLTPQPSVRPEEYAFPIALDVLNYTIENQISSSVFFRSTAPLVTQYQLAEQISSCFESENIYSWIQFATHSQMLAWSGFSSSQILGAAVNTSTNPFIKALGHMLSELTDVPPTDADHLPNAYNPFLAEEINQIRHERLIDETFEMVLIHAMEAESHIPLLRVANNQNESLLKGRFLGWCANSLHAAAKAYLGAKERGIPPIQAARLEFQSARLQSSWKLLLQLGQNIISLLRTNDFVTIEDLIKWAEETPEAKHMVESLNITLSDPQHIVRKQESTQPKIKLSSPGQQVETRKILPHTGSKTPIRVSPQEKNPITVSAEPTKPTFTFEGDDE